MSRRFRTDRLDPAALASPGSARVMAKRRDQAAACLASASDALRDLERGEHIFGLTKGQFSMIDLAAAVLAKTGPAGVAVWTWCIAEYEIEAVTAFLTDGRIQRFRMVMDWAGSQRDMPLIADMQERFGADCIRVTKTHAKIVTVSTDDGWRVVIRGSMNLNANPRFEQFDVSEGPEAFGVVETMMAELWARSPALPVRELTHAQAVAGLDLDEGVPAAPLAWSPAAKPWWPR